MKFIKFSLYRIFPSTTYDSDGCILTKRRWQKKTIKEYNKGFYFPSSTQPIFSSFVALTTYHAFKANSVKVLSTIIPENICCTMWAWCTPVLDFCYLRNVFEKIIFLKGEEFLSIMFKSWKSLKLSSCVIGSWKILICQIYVTSNYL